MMDTGWDPREGILVQETLTTNCEPNVVMDSHLQMLLINYFTETGSFRARGTFVSIVCWMNEHSN